MEPRPRYHAPLYKGSGKLQDKAALITGGDSGIGRAVAVLFARIAPGPIWTPFIPQDQGKDTAQHGRGTPMGRPGRPEEVPRPTSFSPPRPTPVTSPAKS